MDVFAISSIYAACLSKSFLSDKSINLKYPACQRFGEPCFKFSDAQSTSSNSPNTAIGYVNFFMDNYPQSKYYPDVLETRAKLFRLTGRYDNCIADADKIISKGGDMAEDALFIHF